MLCAVFYVLCVDLSMSHEQILVCIMGSFSKTGSIALFAWLASRNVWLALRDTSARAGDPKLSNSLIYIYIYVYYIYIYVCTCIYIVL